MKLLRDSKGHFIKGTQAPTGKRSKPQKAPNRNERTCIKCGSKFLGGTTAKYCYDCK